MNATTTATGKPFWKSPLFPMVCLFFVFSPVYLWSPASSGPALFCYLPVFLFLISMQVHQNTQRLERLERAFASKEGPLAPPAKSEPGAASSAI